MVRLSGSLETMGHTWGYEAVAFVESRKLSPTFKAIFCLKGLKKSMFYIRHKQKEEE